MICPKCNSTIPDDSKICEICGHDLTSESADEPSPDENRPNTMNENSFQVSPDETGQQAGKKKANKLQTAAMRIIQAAVLVIMYYTVQFAVSMPFVFIASRSVSSQDELIKIVNDNTILISIISNLVMILVILIISGRKKTNISKRLRIFNVSIVRIIGFAVLGILLNFMISSVVYVLPIPESVTNEHIESFSSVLINSHSIIVNIFGTALVTGIAEELLFRAAMITILRKPFGKMVALIISSAVFAFMHGSLISIIYAFVIGMVFGAMYLVYDSVIPSMVCHVFFNLSSFFMIVPNSADNIVFWIVMAVAVSLLVVLCIWLFKKYPSMLDIMTDKANRITGKTEEQNQLLEKIRNIRDSREMTSEEYVSLSEEWTSALKHSHSQNSGDKSGDKNETL